MTWRSYYRLDTGEILPIQDRPLRGQEPPVPDGCAFIEGLYDHLSQRVDLDTGEVVDWQPPKPEGDEYTDHEWNADAKRWMPVLTLAGEKRRVWDAIKVRREVAFASRAASSAGIAYAITKDKGNLGDQIKSIEAAIAVGAATSATTANWRDLDNNPHALNIAGYYLLAAEMGARGQAIYECSWALDAQVQAAADKAALAAIDMEAGWP